MKSVVFLSSEEFNKVIEGIAKQIASQHQNKDGIVLVGVQRGGVYLSERIKTHLRKILNCEIPSGSIDIGMYRDDLSQHLPPPMQPSMIPVDINDKDVILVDDVLFSGRTTRAALDALNDFGRPARVRLAVLIDRGHRELPIKADFVGKYIETDKDDTVKVLFKELDGVDEVIIERP